MVGGKNTDNFLLEAAENMHCTGVKRFSILWCPFAYPSFWPLAQKWSFNKFSFTMNGRHPIECKKAHRVGNFHIDFHEGFQKQRHHLLASSAEDALFWCRLESMKYRVKFNAPVILTFAALCLAVLVFSELTGYRYIQWFVTHRGSLQDPMTYITMVTYVLGHQGWEHFLSNMMLLLLTGPVVEERYGTRNTIIIIVATAVVTALANMAVTANGLIGCSGVVFAFIILCSMTSFKKGEIPLTMILVVILYLGQEIMAGVLTADNISQMAHIMGGIAGAAFGFFLADTKKRR